jgi:N-methylhydantoinase A
VFFAYGGLGPTHVADIAGALEIKKAIIPQAAGVFSSFGMLLAETQHEYVRSYLKEVSQLDYDEFNSAIASVAEEALAVMASAGYGRDRVQLRRMVGLHYSGQSTDLLIPAGEGRLGPEQLGQLVTKFGQEHERTYGFDVPEEPVAVGKISVVATLITIDDARRGNMRGKRVAAGAGTVSVNSDSRQAYFGRHIGWLQTRVLGRQQLEGATTDGPAVVEEYDTTVVIPPGCRAILDDYRNIVIEIHDWRPDNVYQ